MDDCMMLSDIFLQFVAVVARRHRQPSKHESAHPFFELVEAARGAILSFGANRLDKQPMRGWYPEAAYGPCAASISQQRRGMILNPCRVAVMQHR